jgi:uncharacterized RDD family membrane protein YckC
MTNSSSEQLDFNHWIFRLLAYIIDTVIIAIVVSILWTFSTLGSIATNSFWGGTALYWVTFPFLIGLLEVFYFVIFEMLFGSSIGKRLVGFQVMLTSGVRVSVKNSFMRNISKIFWVLLILDWLLGVISPGSDKRQKYSDKYAKTIVVSTRIPYGPPPAKI